MKLDLGIRLTFLVISLFFMVVSFTVSEEIKPKTWLGRFTKRFSWLLLAMVSLFFFNAMMYWGAFTT